MKTNELPKYDASINTTGCCPKFNPTGWDGQDLHFRDKTFVKAVSRSVFHVPVNMSSVFSRVNKHIEEAGAYDYNDFIVLSRDVSPWRTEHLFSVSKRVPEEEMTSLTGDFVTKLFEGPYSRTGGWYEEMKDAVRERGSQPGDIYFFYTTCPKCAKAYGKNYVVGVAAVE
ncbi:hydrolase [Chelativorans xinjiangense]|uniref:hydrolase n=1 Tax=Chelativorans xinjiangense TaxID=2681485 RepID=UPI001357E156|nr:hydrolase [Chelativorans xinjiangense]